MKSAGCACCILPLVIVRERTLHAADESCLITMNHIAGSPLTTRYCAILRIMVQNYRIRSARAWKPRTIA